MQGGSAYHHVRAEGHDSEHRDQHHRDEGDREDAVEELLDARLRAARSDHRGERVVHYEGEGQVREQHIEELEVERLELPGRLGVRIPVAEADQIDRESEEIRNRRLDLFE